MEHNNEINETDVIVLPENNEYYEKSQTLFSLVGVTIGSISTGIAVATPVIPVIGIIGMYMGGFCGNILGNMVHDKICSTSDQKKIAEIYDRAIEITKKYFETTREITIKYLNTSKEIIIKYCGREIKITSEYIQITYDKTLNIINNFLMDIQSEKVEDKEPEKAFHQVAGVFVGVCAGIVMPIGLCLGGLCGGIVGSGLFYIKNMEEAKKDFTLDNLNNRLTKWWEDVMEYNRQYEGGGRAQRRRENFTSWYNRNFSESAHQSYWKTSA
jgi:hypothetical protein